MTYKEMLQKTKLVGDFEVCDKPMFAIIKNSDGKGWLELSEHRFLSEQEILAYAWKLCTYILLKNNTNRHTISNGKQNLTFSLKDIEENK